MLSSSDRQRKFEQLRAHWETADTGESTKMVGRREKQTPQHVVHKNLPINTGNKFRKKLSNGLALISLTQRKGVPGRQLSSNASLAVSAPSTNDSSTAILDNDALLSPQTESTSLKTSDDPPVPPQDSVRASEDHQTPRPLPRSRTFSYIPRPVKLDSDASPVAERDGLNEMSLDTGMTDSKSHHPSRIPTPNPPQSKRRVSSPRQHVPSHQTLQPRIATNHQSFTANVNGSPSKAAVRSKTTPNLVKTSTVQSASFMAPRRPGFKRPFASSTPQKLVLAENVPTSKREAQWQSQVHERPTKRESLAVPSAAVNRRSFEPGAPFPQNKRASFALSVSAKHLSAHLVQTAVTAKCASTKAPEVLSKAHCNSPRPSEETPLAHSRTSTSGSSPTPTLSTVDLLDLPLAPPPRLDADNDTQRRTLGTPNGLGGVWRSSKVFAAANHQVRRFPRSSTFHHFGRHWEAPPLLPPIPDQYKSSSSSILMHPVPQQNTSISTSNLPHRFPMVSGKFGSSSRSLLSDIASTQRSLEAVSAKSMSTSVSTTVSEVPGHANEECHVDEAKTIYRFQHENSTVNTETGESNFQFWTSKSSSDMTASPAIKAKPDLKRVQRSVSVSGSDKSTIDMLSRRRWSISERFYRDSANEDTRVQVKDYMPPLYWAGRFQSRFDKWRTEAMVAVLNPNAKPEDDGPLGQCSLEDEKKATVLIFMQLRDLCASAQAADSLHKFEYKYRRDHKLLDTKFDLSPSLRKPDDSTPKGPIGRAVRKLTPRKASFTNLFKGKGWNRTDDTKTVDVPGHVRELQEIADLSNGLEAEGLDSYESSAQLHAR